MLHYTGAYSVVEECVDKLTDEHLAVKLITKDVPEKLAVRVRVQVLQEVDLLMECGGHENILKLVSFFETIDRYLMVFEKLEGGELLNHIQEREVGLRSNTMRRCPFYCCSIRVRRFSKGAYSHAFLIMLLTPFGNHS